MRRLPALAGFARFPRSRRCAARLVLAITMYTRRRLRGSKAPALNYVGGLGGASQPLYRGERPR